MTTRRLREPTPGGPRFVAALFALSFALSWSLAMPAAADGMQVTPIIQTLAHGHTMAVYRVSNVQHHPLTVQIEAHRWRQQDGKRVLAKAGKLLVVPPLVTLAPGQQQLVRIAYRGPATAGERDYRVRFEEVARRPMHVNLGIGTTVTLDVPLIFLADKPRAEARWRLSEHHGHVRLSLTNPGNRYLRLNGVSVSDAAGDSVKVGHTPQYVLAGNTMNWRLPWPPSLLREGVTVHYRRHGRSGSRKVSFE